MSSASCPRSSSTQWLMQNSGVGLPDELGNWRHKRNKFTQRHFDEYHKIVEKTHPKEDYDDRNALYGL